VPDSGNDGFAGVSTSDTDALLERAGTLIASGRRLPSSALQPLQEGIEHARNNDVRGAFAQAILVLAQPEELPGLSHDLLHHDRSQVREAAYDGLIERGVEALPALETLATEDDRETRWFAYQAAARLDDPAALPLLVRGLRDDDFSIRWTASSALIERGPLTVQSILEALASERPSIPFHEAARRVLSRIDAGPPLDEEVARLVDALGRETTSVESPSLARDIVKRLWPRP